MSHEDDVRKGEKKEGKKKKERRLLESVGREGGSLSAGFWKSPISQMSGLLQQGGGKSRACEAIEERNEQHGSKSKSCWESRSAKKGFSGSLLKNSKMQFLVGSPGRVEFKLLSEESDKNRVGSSSSK